MSGGVVLNQSPVEKSESSEWGRFLPELLGWWLLVGDAAAAKSLQLCLTLYNLTDSSPPGSPSLGFSRQEHWSGLPFPSPMHESEKWKWSRSVVSDSSWPHGLQPTRLLCPWDLPGKRTGVGCHLLGGSITPQISAHEGRHFWCQCYSNF